MFSKLSFSGSRYHTIVLSKCPVKDPANGGERIDRDRSRRAAEAAEHANVDWTSKPSTKRARRSTCADAEIVSCSHTRYWPHKVRVCSSP